MWQVCARLRTLRRWQRQQTELDEEIRFHLAEETEEHIAAGMSPEDARAAARRDFGNVPLLRELTRETWGWGPAERLIHDVRSAIRGMRRNPGYTVAVVFTLALGIGLNAAMYDMLSRLFLQPPPHVENPDGIHRVWVRQGGRGDPNRATDSLPWREFIALRADTDRFRAAGRYSLPWPTPNGRGQTAEELQLSRVTGGFFGLLGARPAMGRPILPEDDDPAAAPVAVIGNGYWERRFGRTRRALGATVTFDDVTYTIVGAMPPGFSGSEPSAADVWVPFQAGVAVNPNAWVTPLVRLAPGVTAEAAGAAATAVLRAARAETDPTRTEATVVLGPLLRTRGPAALSGDMRLPLVVGGVALLGAEGAPDAELELALAHAEGDDRVEAEGGEEQSQQGGGGEQAGADRPRSHPPCMDVGQGPHAAGRQVGKELGERGEDGHHHGFGIAPGADDEAAVPAD